MLVLLISLFLIPYASSQLSFTSHQEFTGINPSPPHSLPPSPVLKTRPTTVYRPRSLEALHRTRLRSLYYAQSGLEQLIWDPVNIHGPDIEDLHTLEQLSRMSGNAYALPDHQNWYEIDHAWNSVRILSPFLLNSLPFFLCLRIFLYYRAFHLVGRLQMALGAISFYPLTIPPLCFPSKEQLFKVQLPSSINSMTTCRFGHSSLLQADY